MAMRSASQDQPRRPRNHGVVLDYFRFRRPSRSRCSAKAGKLRDATSCAVEPRNKPQIRAYLRCINWLLLHIPGSNARSAEKFGNRIWGNGLLGKHTMP